MTQSPLLQRRRSILIEIRLDGTDFIPSSKGKQPEQQRSGDASGGSHTPAVAPAKAAARATDTAPALSRDKTSALATEKAPTLALKAGAAPSESKINDTLSKTRKTRAGAKASADVATVTNKAATAAVPATPSEAMAGPIKAAASTPAKAVTERCTRLAFLLFHCTGLQ